MNRCTVSQEENEILVFIFKEGFLLISKYFKNEKRLQKREKFVEKTRRPKRHFKKFIIKLASRPCPDSALE